MQKKDIRIFTEKDYKGLQSIRRMEKVYIRLALEKFNGKKCKAAIALQITERQLYYKIIQHSLYDFS